MIDRSKGVPFQLEYDFNILEYARVCGLIDNGKLYNEVKTTLKNMGNTQNKNKKCIQFKIRISEQYKLQVNYTVDLMIFSSAKVTHFFMLANFL